MDHEDVCRLIAKAGTKMEMIVERFSFTEIIVIL